MAARYLGLDCHLLLRTSKALVDQDPGLVGEIHTHRRPNTCCRGRIMTQTVALTLYIAVEVVLNCGQDHTSTIAGRTLTGDGGRECTP